MSAAEWADEELVEELKDIDRGLSEWEVAFVDSLAEGFARFGSLTPKQRAKAVQIIDRLADR